MNEKGFKKTLEVDGRKYIYFSLREIGDEKVKNLPFSLRVILENLIRYLGDGNGVVSEEHINSLLSREKGKEIPFFPERVILQDFTGIPLITDLAVMRDTVKKLGYNPKIINPVKRCDLVIDHSVQVDFFGTSFALELNMKKEFERNKERYIFLKWAQKAFKNFRVIPPGKGIIHQVNIEYLADVVRVEKVGKEYFVFPDTLLGTDSHTTMVNSLGVLGWGVGGIEAEAVMLGEPYYIVIPEVIGVRLKGKPKDGVTATDIVLTITHILRKKGVVDKFVEFFGEGVKELSTPDRATISNMCPEYGARCAFFPPDDETISYLRLTARPEKHVKIVEKYLKENMLFQDHSYIPQYDDVVEIDLGEVEPCVAGPSRPHDRVPLRNLKQKFKEYLGREPKEVEVEISEREKVKISDGSVIISAITSCTNTSNPYLMISAGLVAKKAVEKGLRTPAWVKTSNAPGSRVVVEYLEKAELMPYLEALGYHITGYGCTVCIGNSGPINRKIEEAIKNNKLTCVAVLSGNRNFEARIHLLARANFLMSPPLVVAFGLAGRIDIDVERDPIGYDPNGNPVFLKDIMPSKSEIDELMNLISPSLFKEKYKDVFEGTDEWEELPSPEGDTFAWDDSSTYIKPPPFFDDFSLTPPEIKDIKGARVLLVLGDTITTDHISPAGEIGKNSPAGRYLIEKGVPPEEFNNYGARRGNWEVMVRGTFSNVRIKNLMLDGVEGGFSIHIPSGKVLPVFDVAKLYENEKVPLIVLAGKEYGSGSSRDWAAKGTALLGIKAVIAESFETIHRSNLVGMGVVPLEFKDTNVKELKITGREIFNIPLSKISPGGEIEVEMIRENGEIVKFPVRVKINAKIEIDYIRHGGILPYVLRKLVEKSKGKRRGRKRKEVYI